jgi:hypothetical protein
LNWQDIQNLRKSGQLEQAENAALKILADNPQDFRARSQYEWVIFDQIKQIVSTLLEAQDKNQPINSYDLDELMGWMRKYYNLQPRRPEMACSNILGQLVKVGRNLRSFPEIVGWIGIDGLRPEDWEPNCYQGKTYPSLAIKIARELCKWVSAHPDASQDQMSMALEWAERVAATTSGDDTLWLTWDTTVLFRRMGNFHRAAELLASVIKAKKNEFWVWAEAGRLYKADQPDLALACFCRALECPTEPKFLVRAHIELAQLLADQNEHTQASREIAIAIEIRQAEGWPIGKQIEELIACSWYNPSAEDGLPPKDFYAKHSPDALALCFDVIETRPANYLGLLIPHKPKDAQPGWKPRPLSRFVLKCADDDASTLVNPGKVALSLEMGAPMTIVIGRQNGENRETIIHMSVRPDGVPWDCLIPYTGVVTRDADQERPMRVFIADMGDEVNVDGAVEETLCIGDGVLCGLARNPKTDRLSAFHVDRGELPDKNIKVLRGDLKRHPKGFAFVEDSFVAPPLVEALEEDVQNVEAVAVYGNHPSEDRRSWRVISIEPAE